jgi:hypothetical protein
MIRPDGQSGNRTYMQSVYQSVTKGSARQALLPLQISPSDGEGVVDLSVSGDNGGRYFDA